MTIQKNWQRGVSLLTAIYVSRLLGLFMVFPVFSLYAQTLEGANKSLIGVALGVYGLSQGILQIPYGWLSDRFGRKPMIISGLLLFVAGSILAAIADSIQVMIIARAIQGMGAISAVTLAYAADLTPPEKLGRTMAIIGGSIGMAFVFALITGPLMASWIGGRGLFIFIAVMASLALVGGLILPPVRDTQLENNDYDRRGLWHASASIFALNTVFTATFLILPALLLNGGIEALHHWWVYLPANLIALCFMRYKNFPHPLSFGISFMLLAISIGFLVIPFGTWWLAFAITLYFIAYYRLETGLPHWVAKIADSQARGKAMGIFSSAQFIGSFTGGAIGGMLWQHFSIQAVLILLVLLTATGSLALLKIGKNATLKEQKTIQE